jgi:ribonucleotide monophosphatase NagD (HAD superfamily)
MGKPSAAFFWVVTGSLALPPAECLMIGDDVEADVCGARSAGLQAALVQTGKYRAALTWSGCRPMRPCWLRSARSEHCWAGEVAPVG